MVYDNSLVLLVVCVDSTVGQINSDTEGKETDRESDGGHIRCVSDIFKSDYLY